MKSYVFLCPIQYWLVERGCTTLTWMSAFFDKPRSHPSPPSTHLSRVPLVRNVVPIVLVESFDLVIARLARKTSRHRRAWCRWATIAHLQCIIAATPVSYSSSLPTILSELLTLCPPLLFSSRLLLARWRAGGHDSHPLKPNEGEHVKVENNQFSNCPLKTKWSLNESYGLRDMQLIVLVYFLGPITTRLKIPLHD